MLSGHSVIYFGPGRWEGMWRNRHHLMSRLARHNRVLYVEPKIDLQTFRHRWRSGQWGWADLKRELDQSRVSQPQENLYIYHSPTYAPVSGRFPLDRLTWWWWFSLLKAVLRELKFEQPIVWLSQPDMVKLLGQLRERLVIYHVVDEYTAYQGVDGELERWLRQQEVQLLTRADLVIVVSAALWEAKRVHNPHTYLVPNGVDAQAFSRTPRIPTDLQRIPAPRLIYAGLIGARLDLDLLAALMQRRPEWSLVLLGEVNATGAEAELQPLRRLPNVHFLGVKPAGDVPDYLMLSDVCVLPYRQNRETQYIDPLKLYEGLMAGKPVIATPIPAVKPFQEWIALAETADEFEAAVQAALTADQASQAAQRQAVAAAYTWERRVEQISELIRMRVRD